MKVDVLGCRSSGAAEACWHGCFRLPSDGLIAFDDGKGCFSAALRDDPLIYILVLVKPSYLSLLSQNLRAVELPVLPSF